MNSIKIDGAACVVNALTPVVRDRATSYTAVPPDEAHLGVLSRETERWLTFAVERTRMTPRVVTAKALSCLAYSVHRGARSLAVPSKLTGTREHQRRLWELVRAGYRPYEALGLDLASTDGITVTYDGDPIGAVQTKHVPWARPLVPFGLTVHLARVTGSDREGWTLGVNVVFGNVGEALGKLLDALGTSGDGHAGDGQTGAVPVVRAIPRPAVECLPSTTLPEPLDVVLYRTVDGRACASLEHIVRHSPTGLDWARIGAGCADLALSILTRVAGVHVAEQHYVDFHHEVVAALPFAGGVLRAEDVRRWLSAQSSPRPAA